MGARACRVRRRRLGARRDPRPAGRRLGPRDRRAAGPAPGGLPGRGLREPVRDGRRARGRRRRTRSRPSARDHDYADFRRPAPRRVRRRHRARPRPARLHGQRDRVGRPGAGGGAARAPASSPGSPTRRRSRSRASRTSRPVGLRAVGEPAARFREDALRMVRAVRLAAVLEFEIDPPTFEAIRANAALAAHVSGERVAAELQKLLGADRPSIGLRLHVRDGPARRAAAGARRAARRSRRTRSPGEDLFDHTLRTVDAVPAEPAGGAPRRAAARRRQALHDRRGAVPGPRGRRRGDRPAQLLDRLQLPKRATERVVHLVRNHMFTYEPELGRRRDPPVHPAGRDRLDRRPVRAARGGQRRQRRWRSTRTTWPTCGGASRPSWRRRSCSIDRGSRCTATT